jgi:hypothetical protein
MTTAQRIFWFHLPMSYNFQTDSVQGLYYNSGTSITQVWGKNGDFKKCMELGGNAGTTPATHLIGTD